MGVFEVPQFAKGTLADFVMIDRDLTRIPPETIRDARIMLTVVGGKPVFQRAEKAATN